ncbi:MAG: 2,3,4,5-tetrahydropyridine-2,6-carboxylate N-succinyltransferase, partial [Gammaproteobacteria bacterium]|nr:2,3,4,5-tetrahydropyridine-2,6-carboxylate N-succinyltransferase [Gammaproteobacteria bacterium]NNJ73290.1 2,3,4,5-tetrahydropyridine-2,6-carboxylate N-succinyltransferase [Enterobacterales bacterium]
YNAWLYAIAGTVIFTIYHNVDNDLMSTEVHALIKSSTVWLFLFGFTGLFIRYFSEHSAKMRYVSDSAYWVYLLHLPLTAFLPGVVAGLPLPDVVKFLLVVIGTGIVCFSTYHLFVRNTFIGQFLNGRKYTRKISDIATNQAATVDEPKAS